MLLNNEQFELMKVFYENEIILYTDLPKYGTIAKSALIRSLTSNYYIRTQEFFKCDGYKERTYAYKIQPAGKTAYETCLREKELLSLQQRQTSADEKSAEEAHKANTKSTFSILLSVVAIIVSIVALIIEAKK